MKAKYSNKKWFSIEPEYQYVSYKQFKKFISDYPRVLERDACGISTPPCITYNDFELANRWPWSVVATTYLYETSPKSRDYVPPKERTYRIMTNFEEVFNSRTGYKE